VPPPHQAANLTPRFPLTNPSGRRTVRVESIGLARIAFAAISLLLATTSLHVAHPRVSDAGRYRDLAPENPW
jgi:hypothetical protein